MISGGIQVNSLFQLPIIKNPVKQKLFRQTQENVEDEHLVKNKTQNGETDHAEK